MLRRKLTRLGATNNVCTNLSAFTHYTKITPVLINLPNGQNVFAHYSGLVKFSDKFYLLDVLYVPQLKLNFISASKLSLQLKCTLTFNSTHYIIQDNRSHEKIGTIKAIVGLYLLILFMYHHTPHHKLIFLILIVILRINICGTIEWVTLLMKD